jgi:anti-sigma factor RsiW
MNADAARALFEQALDGQLDPRQRAEFDAALAEDPALRVEYEELVGFRATTARLARAEPLPSVDLLAGVQHKLRARSGGKFYRDRFAERRGASVLRWGLMATCLLMIIASAWLVLTNW